MADIVLTQKDLEKLEKLSKIRIPHEKEEEYIKKLNSILDFIRTLSNIDTKGIKPIAQVTNLENVLREDEITPSLSQKDVLKNSKHTYKGYFKLPKVIE